MAKFRVRLYQDAYAIQEANVEASDADAAAKFAYKNRDRLKWGLQDIQTFDACGVVTLNDEEMEIDDTRHGKLWG